MPGCQRWLHFYALNELTNTILICYYITQFPFHKACLYYAVTYLIFYASLCIQLSIRRRCKSSYQQYQNIFANGKPNHPNYGPSSFRITSVTARDGFVLNNRTTFNSSLLLREHHLALPTLFKTNNFQIFAIFAIFALVFFQTKKSDALCCWFRL